MTARAAGRRRTVTASFRVPAVLVAFATAALLAPWPRAIVEESYSQRIYPSVRHQLTWLMSSVRLSIFDLALLLALLWLGRLWWRAARARQPARMVAVVAASRATLLALSIGYLAFLALWGLNYSRVPLEHRLDFDSARITTEQATALAHTALAAINHLHAPAHSRPWPELRDVGAQLDGAFRTAQRAIGDPIIVGGVAPKPTLMAPYFRVAAVDGMTSPYTLEVLVNPWVLPFERAMIVAHEWGHVAGYARESEASYVGLVTCMNGDVQAQYSAWLFLLPHALSVVPEPDRSRVLDGLGPGPRADLRAIADRYRQSLPRLRAVAWRAYDSFLRANRVPSGMANYDEVLTLVLGTDLPLRWQPSLRTTAGTAVGRGSRARAGVPQGPL